MEYKIEKIEETIEKNYLPYAMSVILSRALPEIDGFKPSHRKILYTMYKMGLLTKQRTKSANVVGQTMKLNPHGDSAIYQTLVRMSVANETLLYPYIESKGNFGKVYSKHMQFAASRYTEIKLHKICENIFSDIEKNTVDFEPNYDDTMFEPKLLPVKFPTILVNPNKGIAVGMASNICSFNLEEITNATIAIIDDKDVNLTKYIKGPDFSTGGSVKKDTKVLKEVLETGLGSFYLRAKYNFDSLQRCIEITEIPYTTTIEAIIERIIFLIKRGELKAISDIRDESDLKGLKIAIDIKRGYDYKEVMQTLYGKTTLEDFFSCNFNLIVNGAPMQLGVRDILIHWLDFRLGAIRRKIRFEIDQLETRLHLIEALKKILLDIDKVIKLIRETKKETDVIPRLKKFFLLDDEQAEFVANIRLRNINKEFIIKRINEEKELIKSISELKIIYSSDKLINERIKEELLEISKKYSAKRKTIVETFKDIEIEEAPEVIEERIVFTKENYIKRLDLKDELKLRFKDNDKLSQDLIVKTDEELLMVGSLGNMYKIKVFDLKKQRANELGQFIPNIITLEQNEEIVYIKNTKDFDGNFIFVFENAKVTKTPLEAFKTKQNREQLKNAYSTESKLIFVSYSDESEYLFMEKMGKKQRALLVDIKKILVKKTKGSKGVTVLRLNKNEKLVNARLYSNIDKLKKYLVARIPQSGKNYSPL